MTPEQIKELIETAICERAWRAETDIETLLSDGDPRQKFRVVRLKDGLADLRRFAARFKSEGFLRELDRHYVQSLLRGMADYFLPCGDSCMEYGEERNALSANLREAAKLRNLRQIMEVRALR